VRHNLFLRFCLQIRFYHISPNRATNIFSPQKFSTDGVADLRLLDINIILANNTFALPGLAGQRSVDFFLSNLTAENNIWNGYLTSQAEGQTAPGISKTEDYNLFFNAPLGAGVTPSAHSLTADPQFASPLSANFRLISLPTCPASLASWIRPARQTPGWALRRWTVGLMNSARSSYTCRRCSSMVHNG
jgi:hypothetical protein